MSTLFRFKRQQVLAFKQNVTRRDLIAFPAGQHMRQRAFTGTVRPHDGVHFAAADIQIQTPKDCFIFDGDL